jgi:argininosuccinate lyase
MFATLKVNKQKMKQASDSGYLSALDIAEMLVKQGIPFRTAHKMVGKLVQTAYESKKPLSKLTLAEIGKSVKEKDVSASKLLKMVSSVDANSSLTQRRSTGSSGFSEQKRMITTRNTKVRQYGAVITKRTNQISFAIEKLAQRTQTLTK